MPRNGGRCRKLWKETAVTMVQPNRNMMRFAPRFMTTSSSSTEEVSFFTAQDMKNAGMM